MDEIKEGSSHETVIVDSLPIITYSARRKPKVAPCITGKDYCAAKNLFYHGCKIHLLSGMRPRQMPLSRQAGSTPANVDNLTALKPYWNILPNTTIFANKAYSDIELRKKLQENNLIILTLLKSSKLNLKGWNNLIK